MEKYLRINAIDPYEIGLQGILINLDTNTIESGKIVLYDRNNFTKTETVDIKDYCKKFNNIWVKVVDNGRYETLDENFNVITNVQGYVPDWIDSRFNVNKGFGDYIDFRVDENCKLITNGIKSEQLISTITKALMSPSSENQCYEYIGRLYVIKNKLEKSKKHNLVTIIDNGINKLINKLKQWKN